MDNDVEAAELRASVRKQLFGDDVPVSIGRYRIQQRLGRGGMGIVYSAFDPQLGRRVALKVLRPGGRHKLDPDRAARLVREARAMARLSHPNVAAVYEVGNVGNKVYIAMEFVEGLTLRAWLREGERPWPQIVRIFVDAGRGLEAAHRAGLVHRDFKPDNVMVSDDARVRVLDFGLARANLPNPSTEGVDTGEPSSDDGDDPLTETGTVLGTPAYMAPEQSTPGLATAASDQFAFCVALHEAVFGVRPAQAEGSPASPRRVPPALRRIVDRGLAREPDDRYPSMAELVDELEGLVGRRRPWGWIAAGALGVALAVTAVVALSIETPATEPPCPDPDTQTLQVWSPERAARVDAAVEGAPSFAQDAWPGARALLLRRLDALGQAADESCRATHVQHTQSDAAFAWRDQCFTAQLQEIDTVLGLVEEGQTDAIQHIGSALGGIDPVEACSEERARRLPSDPPPREHLARIQKLRIALAHASAQLRIGQYEEAAAATKTVVEQAHQLGYKPLMAEALLDHGRALRAASKADAAERYYYDAIEAAEASHHDEITARAWIGLVTLLGVDLARIDDAQRLLAPAQGAVARLGHSPLLEADLWTAEAQVLDGQGKYDRAVELHRRALAVYAEAHEPYHPAVTRSLSNLAGALRRAGRPQEARGPLEQALAMTGKRVGSRHPDFGDQLVSLGSDLGMLGKHEAAIEQFSRAIEVYEAALGNSHVSLAAALHNRGNSLAGLRRFDEAIADLERANAIDDTALGKDNPIRATNLYALGQAYKFKGDLTRAEETFSRALSLQEREWGSHHPNLAYAVAGLGSVAAARKDFETAVAHFGRARRLIRDGLGPKHPRLVYTCVAEALARLELGEVRQATTLLEEALQIGREGGNEPLQLAEAEFALARAIVADGGNKARATQLATAARSTFAAAGDHTKDIVEEIDGWLAKNAGEG